MNHSRLSSPTLVVFYLKLTTHLENIDFQSTFQNKDANKAWDSLKGIIEDTIDRYIPLTPRRKEGDPKRFSKNHNADNFDRFKLAKTACKKGVLPQNENLSTT